MQLPTGEPSLFGYFVSSVALIAAGVLWLRRHLSRDSVELAKDRGETNLISKLQSACEEAKEDARMARAEASAVRETRINDAQRIAGLEAQNEYLDKENERLTRENRRLVGMLPDHVQRAMVTGFGEFPT